MSLVLSSDDKVARVKFLQRLSLDKIIQVQRTASQIHNDLDTAERSLAFWKSQDDHKEQKKHIKAVETYIKSLNEQLSNTVRYPTLRALCDRDEEGTLYDIQLLIIDVVKFFNTSEVMSDDQIAEVATLITGAAGGLTLEDIGYCFHQAKTGHHGKVYNRVDGGVIMNWIMDYKEEKRKKIAAIQQSRHAQSKVDSKRTIEEQASYRAVQPRAIADMMPKTERKAAGTYDKDFEDKK